MWDMLFKAIGIKPEEIKPQIEAAILTVKSFDERLTHNEIILNRIAQNQIVLMKHLMEEDYDNQQPKQLSGPAKPN